MITDSQQTQSADEPRRSKCRVCFSPLNSCDACHTITCRKYECAGSKSSQAGIKICRLAEHPDSGEDRSDATLNFPVDQCPICRNWFCRRCMPVVICQGPIEAYIGDPAATLLEHPRKIVSCRGCFGTRPGSNLWCAESNCPRRYRYLCDDCSAPRGGDITCPCGETWICDACAYRRVNGYDSGRHCPKCKTFYCFEGCGYIDICRSGTCKDNVFSSKARLCNDCIELEEDPAEKGGKESEGTSLTTVCNRCQLRVCTECFDEGKVICRACYEADQVRKVLAWNKWI